MRASFLIFLLLLAATPVLLASALAVLMRLPLARLRRMPGQVTVVSCALFGNIPFGIAAYALYLQRLSSTEEFISGIIYFLLVYNAIAYSFFHVFNMSETARRIKILSEIRTAGSLEVGDLRSCYSNREMLSNRIERLLASGQIQKKGTKFVLVSPLLYYAAKAVSLWGRVLGLPSMGSIYIKKGGPSPFEEDDGD